MPHALIIEDEELVASTMIDLLNDLGVESCAVAATEAEAVAAAMQERPDLVTVDVSLKQGNGIDAVRKIRGTLGSLPVLYVTATPMALVEDREAIALRKPFTRDAFANAIEYLLHGEHQG